MMRKITKNLNSQPAHRRYGTAKVRFGTLVFGALMVSGMVAPYFSGHVARADKYDEQINAIKLQIADYDNRRNDLRAQADNLQNKIADLQLQQQQIQAQINLTTAERNSLQQKIAELEAKIKRQATALSESLKTQYLNGEMSALDILMNSHSISDYVDRQTQQKVVSDNIKKSVDNIKSMKIDLEKKKKRTEVLLASQQDQKAALGASRQEQQTLLDQTKGQDAAYQALTKQSNDRIAQLKQQQAAEIAARMRAKGGNRLKTAAGTACGGGYPDRWCHAPKDSMVDSYGMYSRECVSYAAFKVASTYGWPSYWTRGGNDANNWLGRARGYGIPTGSTPKPGAVAVMRNGTYGHVAWVESVNSDGTFNYSDYNSDNRGNYAMHYNANPGLFDGYIYFAQMP